MSANEPTAVVLWMRDGRVIEEVFASRFLAECFLALVPFVTEPDGAHEVGAAMLSPLLAVSENADDIGY